MALIRKYGFWIFAVVSALFYYFFAQKLQRTDHLELILSFVILIALWLILQRFIPKNNWKWLFGIGFAFRLCFLFATPHLSDDYFRFLWDGELSKDGYSVFAFVPSQYKDHVAEKHQEKYGALLSDSTAEFPSGMNSKNYYSIYPSVNQFVFQTSAFGNDPNRANLDLLRVWVLLAEIVSFFLLKSLLTQKNQANWLGLYWLNPLIIIELTGNLHLEALAITFILLALFLASKNKWLGTALALSLGVMTKLTPLLLLGAFFRGFHWKKWLLLSFATGILSIGIFALYIDPSGFLNFKESVGLFFAWFSFNTGIYYGLREIAWVLSRNDISAWISLFFPFISAAIMLQIVFFKRHDVATTALLLFTTYFLFTPILHPWYITILIPLALLSKKIYPLVWSVLIFGSYLAYGATFQEPLWWIFIEFAVVLFLLFSEFRKTTNWTHRLSNIIYT